jgi:hypothetical protein
MKTKDEHKKPPSRQVAQTSVAVRRMYAIGAEDTPHPTRGGG